MIRWKKFTMTILAVGLMGLLGFAAESPSKAEFKGKIGKTLADSEV